MLHPAALEIHPNCEFALRSDLAGVEEVTHDAYYQKPLNTETGVSISNQTSLRFNGKPHKHSPNDRNTVCTSHLKQTFVNNHRSTVRSETTSQSHSQIAVTRSLRQYKSKFQSSPTKLETRAFIQFCPHARRMAPRVAPMAPPVVCGDVWQRVALHRPTTRRVRRFTSRMTSRAARTLPPDVRRRVVPDGVSLSRP